MTPSSGWIEATVMRIQGDFLDHPHLTMTSAQAQRRYALEAGHCEAIMGALVDAGVLTRTVEGRYARHFPSFAARQGAGSPAGTKHAA